MTHSITESGKYLAGIFPMSTHKEWAHNAVYIHRWTNTRRSLAALAGRPRQQDSQSMLKTWNRAPYSGLRSSASRSSHAVSPTSSVSQSARAPRVPRIKDAPLPFPCPAASLGRTG